VVEVELPARARPAAPRLPAAALIRHEGQTCLRADRRDDKGSTFEAARSASSARAATTSVVDGIKAGERVAIKGVSGLKAMLTGVGKE
jgi:hypothetical protein